MCFSNTSEDSGNYREKGKTAKDLGTQRIIQWWVPWVFFLSHMPELGAEAARNLEMLNRQTETKQNKTPTKDYIQRTKKREIWQDRKLLDNNSSTPAKHHRKHYSFTPTHDSKGQTGSLGFYTCEAVMRHPTLWVGWCQRGSTRELGLPSTSLSLERSQRRPRRESGLSRLFNGNEVIPVAVNMWKSKFKMQYHL